MTQYIVEMYDKDTDYWETVETTGNITIAYNTCRVVANLIKQDMVINRFNGRTEPFDYVQVRQFITGGKEDKVLMVNEDLQ